MLNTRVIPCLLIRGNGLVKTMQFKEPRYVGDPINAVRIFNEKEVDELILLDIEATVNNKKPNMKLIVEIVSECFMPVCYGGGISSVEEIREIFNIGIEKVAINSFALKDPFLIKRAADHFGSQSIVVSMDVKKNVWGKYAVYTHGGKINTKRDPVEYAVEMERMACGELLLNSIDRDGTSNGYDIELIKRVSNAVSIPVIACGGAGKLADFSSAVKEGGASAVAAGSFFVFHGKHRAVLLSYPPYSELRSILQ